MYNSRPSKINHSLASKVVHSCSSTALHTATRGSSDQAEPPGHGKPCSRGVCFVGARDAGRTTRVRLSLWSCSSSKAHSSFSSLFLLTSLLCSSSLTTQTKAHASVGLRHLHSISRRTQAPATSVLRTDTFLDNNVYPPTAYSNGASLCKHDHAHTIKMNAGL